MEIQLLKNVLTKLKTTEVIQVLDRWRFLSSEDTQALSSWNTKQTKKVLSNKIADFCWSKGGLTMEHVGDLDLICTQIYSMKKTWNAYHLTEIQGKSSNVQKKLHPETFKTELTRLLKLYFTPLCTASVMLHNGLLWGRVYLPHHTQKQYQPSRCLYFVYYPQTPVIIMNGMKAAFETFLSQCLLLALGYRDITEMSLNGHDMESIAELAINKFSNGGFSRFQLKQRPNGPIGEVRSRKRKAPDIEEHERVSCENLREKRRRLEMLDSSFGTTIQPTLEKIEYKVELPYRGQDIAGELRNQEELFNSRVRFHGKSVLEGIRNLGATGFATVPLPKHLTCVPSRARNYFLLAKKQQTSHQSNSERGADQSAIHQEQRQTANQSTPVRTQNRTAMDSAAQREETTTAVQMGKKSLTEVNKNAQRTKIEKKQPTKQKQQKILRENQSLNVTKDSNDLSKTGGRKTENGRRENANVPKESLIPTRSQQRLIKQKSKR